MKAHTKIYMSYFGYGIEDFIPCEITWFESNGEKEARVADVHHVNGRGKGKDVIENLLGCTRENHERCEGKRKPVISKEKQKEIHAAFMEKFSQ